MTDEQAEELGRRLVACEGFRWMRGMLDGSDHSLIEGGEWGVRDGDTWTVVVGGMVISPSTLGWPDLRDPATLGCVLALVRERWPDASAQRLLGHAVDPVWEVRTPVVPSFPGAYVCRSIYEADTEAEALVAALEAAR